MKVCVLAGGSFEKNRAEYHLTRDFIAFFLDKGAEVSLIQKYENQQNVLPDVLRDRPGFRLHEYRVEAVKKKNFIGRMLGEMTYYLRAVKAVRKEKDSDVFFLQSNNCAYLPIFLIHLFTRKPVLYNEQDIFPQNAFLAGILGEKSLPGRILFGLQKWALRHADGVITISEDMKKTLQAAGAKNVWVAYNWKNDGNGEKLPGYDDGKFHAVYAGNIGVMQNVELLIEAARYLKDNPEICIDIYGNGAHFEGCKVKAEGLANVCFREPVPVHQAFSLYENADVNLVPLAKGVIATALPSKTAVCLQCGKPVIFCFDEDAEFSKEMINAGCPVVSPEDAEGLAKAILEMQKTPVYPDERAKAMFDKEKSLETYGQAVKALMNC